MQPKNNQKPSSTGAFISFEGTDCSGKTTTITALREYLTQLEETQTFPFKGVVFTREPGGSNILVAEKIRKILLKQEPHDPLSAVTEMLLFASARAEHVTKLVLPSLAANKLVISDRYVDSSYVYQGLNISESQYKKVTVVNEIATGGLKPDITFYLQIDEALLKQRCLQRLNTSQFNYLDQKQWEENLYNQTAKNFERLIQEQSKTRKFIILNGADPIEENVVRIWNEILAWKQSKLKQSK